MKVFNKQLIEKFFGGTCTPEEAEQVLDWLETSEGQEYLDERLENEVGEWDEEENKQPEYSPKKEKTRFGDALDSEMLFQRIIDSLGWCKVPRLQTFLKPLIQVAAGLCVIAAASLFFSYSAEKVSKSPQITEIRFSTDENQQKQITLRDGSVVRLNSRSEIMIYDDYNQDDRSVILQGEAFFDVIHQPKKPFIIKAGASEIEVLGTSFNVKITDNNSSVGVAVTDGKVRLSHSDRKRFSQTVVLEKGYYGDLNSENGQILIDDTGIENYLSWKSGRLIFESMSMEKVCVQLGRIYGADCSFGDSIVKNRILTANFSSEDLNKTLSVIGLSLNLRYEKEAEFIYWYNKE